MPQAPAPGESAATNKTACRGAWQYTWEGVTGTDQRYLWRTRRTEGETLSSDQTLERADAGRIRRWKRHQLRAAFGLQQRGTRPVQRLDRAASGRACPAGGGGPPPVYSRSADKLRDAGERVTPAEGPANTLLAHHGGT